MQSKVSSLAYREAVSQLVFLGGNENASEWCWCVKANPACLDLVSKPRAGSTWAVRLDRLIVLCGGECRGRLFANRSFARFPMKLQILALPITLILMSFAVSAAEPIDGRSVDRWKAEPGWSPGKDAAQYGVRDRDGWLEFSAAGAGKLMTWTLEPAAAELAREPRYLVVRYRATGINGADGNYFLIGRDGSPGWRHYLNHRDLVVDGQEHVLAVDVLSYRGPEPIGSLALRIAPAGEETARLLVKIEFTNEVPVGVEPMRDEGGEARSVRIEAEEVEWKPSPEWTPRPPDEHEMEETGEGVVFRMEGQQRSMRWSAKAPEGLDLGEMPFVTVRYRAKGRFGPWGYAFYLGVVDGDGERTSTYAMQPGDVDGDGGWHVFQKQMEVKGVGSSMAIGIDCLSPTAEIEIDYVEYSSRPTTVGLRQVLEYETSGTAWTAGKDGLTVVPLPKSSVPPNHFMVPRLGIGDWFESEEICVAGVPFRVPVEASAMPASGTVDEDRLEVALPVGAKEVLFLLAAAFPSSEPFGASWKRPTPLRMLSEPERLTFELVYTDGTSDHMLPIHGLKGEYGVGHGVAMYAVRPAEGKVAGRLVLHDRMRNAAFGILGVTVNSGEAKVAEPQVQKIWYPAVKKATLSDAVVSFQSDRGLAWGAIRSSMLAESIDLSGRPVFALELGERRISSTEWQVERVDDAEGLLRVELSFSEDGVALRGLFEAKRAARNSVELSVDLVNRGSAAVTGTLFFPLVEQAKLGDFENTWYFCARRGGVINRVPCFWRDEIGESHPLQVDGLFNPAWGAGVSFMPRDLEGVFRWYRMAKDETGCSYSLEFLPETIEPGESWQCVPTAVAVVPGDWKDQLQVYLDWVKTWYRPIAPRKPWFGRVFAFPSYSPTSPMDRPLAERLDFLERARLTREALGACDYMHLFGWAKTEEYGHWGAYDQYFQLGGKDRFIEAVRESQGQKLPVGLYLDGYLVSTRSQKPSQEEREAWAVRTEDGEMLYHKSYDAHSMCPSVPEWREYLTGVYRRVAKEIQPDGMYVDEFGKCMVSRTCYSTEHGHDVPMGMCRAEWELTRQIREAVPGKIATYCEYVPADVACQWLDGAFGHVPLYGHRSGYDDVAPHYVNLQRFAFPDFKTFQLIYSVPLENGNWYLLKYPFFDGDGYYLKGTCLQSDDHSRAFHRQVFRVQHAYAEAFTSRDVEPLVRTEVPNLFANRFSTADETVWTLYNANYRTVRGHVMTVRHREGARYVDAWNEGAVEVEVGGESARLSFEIGPRSVGCVVQVVE